MSGNKYGQHVVVIPEDDADRKLANGFKNHWAVAQRNLVVQPEAGGWMAVLDVFENDYVPYMRKYHLASFVLLIDFDEKGEGRRSVCVNRIPDDLKPRTFLLGTSINPERLRQDLGLSFEQIGTALADDCGRQDLGRWTHPHLDHNLAELHRMLPIVHPILFPGA